MDLFYKIRTLTKYYFSARTYYNLHSPGVFEFISNTLEDTRTYYAFDKIEKLRSQLLKEDSKLEIVDLGAGSKTSQNKIRSIKDVAASALSPDYQCQLLFRIVHYLKPRQILELGTSLGISALYMKEANPNSKFTTIEGSQAIAKIAARNFNLLKQEKIELVVGNFDNVLTKLLPKFDHLDLVYLDGNHQYDATIKYYKMILPYLNENSLLIFDDIYWSEEMSKAWNEIKADPAVRQTIDFYFFGLVFFNKDFKEKQDHIITYSWIKPWQKFIAS